MRFENQTFQNETITIDDNEFAGCTFTDCKFLYSGGEFNIDRIKFNALELTMEGAAGRTVLLLRSLWANELGRQIVLNLLDQRTGARPQ
jgi:hypothetical protein